MVDSKARRQIAEALRHFAAGVITNKEWERRWEAADGSPRDDAVGGIYEAVWPLYSDISVHRLDGPRTLDRRGRRELARWILFLYTDAEYVWPYPGIFDAGTCLLNLLTLGLWGRLTGPQLERKLRMIGDRDVWPFQNTDQLERARREVRLLGKALPQ